MSSYPIKVVESLSGIKAHTLRIWEQRYDILKPRRTDTNIRYYSDDQLRLILNISILNKSGYKISRIANMRPEELQQEVLKIQNTTDIPEFLLDSMIYSMVNFNEQRFEKTLTNALIKLGFEDTFIKLVFPFLNRIGVMWQAGSIRVVQEHFISNLIRRKLIAAIDNVYAEPIEEAKTFVLFLPENESHELLLLFAEYLIRKEGHRVIYIGASLPLYEIDFVAKSFRPDYLVTFITIPIEKQTLIQYLKRLSGMIPSAKIIAGGPQLKGSLKKLPKNILAVNNLQDFIKHIR